MSSILIVNYEPDAIAPANSAETTARATTYWSRSRLLLANVFSNLRMQFSVTSTRHLPFAFLSYGNLMVSVCSPEIMRTPSVRQCISRRGYDEILVQEDVSVYWDIETTFLTSSAASSVSTYDAVGNIRSALAKFGPLRSMRAYWDHAGYAVPTATLSTRSELSSSGVTLIDCPGEGRKAAAMKHMLVDIVLHAWESPSPHTFAIVTGDRDVGYALSALRMRNFRVILMAPAGSHPDLTAQATVQLDWSRGILGVNGGITDKQDKSNDPPPAFGSAGPSVASAPASSTFNPQIPSTRLRRGTLSGFGQAEFQAAELQDFSLRGRRPSLFSKSYDANYSVYGDLGAPFSTPPKAMASAGLGDGPLFPRSHSVSNFNAARSAPQRAFESDRTPSVTPYYPVADFNFNSTTPPPFNNKGKEREFPILEQGYDGPRPPSEGKITLPYSGSMFEPFEDEKPSRKRQASDSPQSAPANGLSRKASVTTLSSESRSSEESVFSLVQRPEPSTAPTSAEQEDGHKFDDVKVIQNNSSSVFPDRAPPSVPAPSVTGFPGQENSTSATVTPGFGSAVAILKESQREELTENRAQATDPVTVSQKKSPSITPILPSNNPPIATPEPPKPSISAPAFTQRGVPVTSTPPRGASVADKAPQKPVLAGASTSRTTTKLPAAWVPLIDVLRKAGGSLTNSQVASRMQKAYPTALQTSGHSKFKKYLNAAMNSGIVQQVVNEHGTIRFHLVAKYA